MTPSDATPDDVCRAIGPHHGDPCSGGRIQSPNAQFTRPCSECGGTGRRRQTVATDAKAETPVCPKCNNPMPGPFRCIVIGKTPREGSHYGPCPKCDPDQRTIYIVEDKSRGN